MPLGQFHHTISSVVGLRPSACEVLLPALTLDETAYCHNRDFFLEYARAAGVRIAPHAKTPMSADIAADLIEAGAWAATVANLQQAEAMLSHGISRILIANGLGGLRNAPRTRGIAERISGMRNRLYRRLSCSGGSAQCRSSHSRIFNTGTCGSGCGSQRRTYL